MFVGHLYPLAGARNGRKAWLRRPSHRNHPHPLRGFFFETALKIEDTAEAARNGKFAHCVIKLEHLLPDFPSVTVLPVVEKRVRHGSKFTIMLSQLQSGRTEPPPGATSVLDGGEPRPPRLRVFNQQQKLIAIAQAIVPRTYQPIVVFDPLP